MTKKEFINRLAEYCEFEDKDLKGSTLFESLEEFDSLAILSIMAFIDENFNLRFTAKQLNDLSDFDSLIALIGVDKFEND